MLMYTPNDCANVCNPVELQLQWESEKKHQPTAGIDNENYNFP